MKNNANTRQHIVHDVDHVKIPGVTTFILQVDSRMFGVELATQIYKPSFDIVATPIEDLKAPCYFPGCCQYAFFDWQVAYGKPVALCEGMLFYLCILCL